jgi:hypothetical protein
MPGLDPGIHDERPRLEAFHLSVSRGLMDCRVKPGNDGGEGAMLFIVGRIPVRAGA